MVKHLACYLTSFITRCPSKSSSPWTSWLRTTSTAYSNSSWLEIALWPQIWSLAPFILDVFNQIHHVFINEAVDTILCTNNFFARNHHKMHLGALFNISLREKGRWGWGGVQIKLLKGRLNTFRIKGANDQIWGHIAISSQLELILFCLWSFR